MIWQCSRSRLLTCWHFLAVCPFTWQKACWLQADTWNCQQFYADPSQGFATRWRQFNGSSASFVSLVRHTGKTGHCSTRWARFLRVLHAMKPTYPSVWTMNGGRPVSTKPSTCGAFMELIHGSLNIIMCFVVISCLTFRLSIFRYINMAQNVCTYHYFKRLSSKH